MREGALACSPSHLSEPTQVRPSRGKARVSRLWRGDGGCGRPDVRSGSLSLSLSLSRDARAGAVSSSSRQSMLLGCLGTAPRFLLSLFFVCKVEKCQRPSGVGGMMIVVCI